MKIRPLSDRIIVRRMEEERKNKSRIVVPDPATAKLGDKILFGRYSEQTGKVKTAGIPVGPGTTDQG
jgi:chaperonin GroES